MHTEIEKAYYRGKLDRLEEEFKLSKAEYYEKMENKISERNAWNEFFTIIDKQGLDVNDIRWESARAAAERIEDEIEKLEAEYEECVETFCATRDEYLIMIYW